MRRRPKGLDSEAVRTLLKYGARLNVAVYKRTGGRIGGRFPGSGAPVCVLRHTGRRSGQVRETPLLHLADGDRVVVVASQGGRAHDPAWYLNVSAHPDVEVLTRGGWRTMRARTAGPDERAELWPRLVAMYADFESYQSWCPREIPVVVLDPR